LDAVAGPGPGEVDRNFGEPGRELSASGELVKMSVPAQVGFLDQVRRFAFVPDDRAHYSIDPLAMAAEEEFEEDALAGLNPTHDLSVRQGFAFLLFRRLASTRLGRLLSGYP